MNQEFKKINSVNGTLRISGDKSISHRALFISSLAGGKSFIRNLSEGDDVKSTINCLKEFGIKIDLFNNEVIVFGSGFRGYQKPLNPLNAGNSGTTARLLAGILAAQNFESIILGDESLSSRPMKRIIEPLTSMGAKINLSDDGKLPLHINSVEKLNPIRYQMLVASAQVKSTIIFAGLHLDEETTVIESIPTRDHTENLLGIKVLKENNKIISSVSRANYPEPKEYFIPGDISSAMYFVVLALLTKNSELIIKDISLNSTRTGALNILKQMGGQIEIVERGKTNNELFGDLVVRSSDLQNIIINKEIVPFIIDEIPVLTIAGIFAEGEFSIRGASELRVKESDRIKSICVNLRKIGLGVEEFDDGFSVGGNIKSASESFESFGDHRIAMAFSILASVLNNGGKVNNFECVNISNPEFLNQINSIVN
jgi:3-phosphoshikimate 1-carboxyvinyltransferase